MKARSAENTAVFAPSANAIVLTLIKNAKRRRLKKRRAERISEISVDMRPF